MIAKKGWFNTCTLYFHDIVQKSMREFSCFDFIYEEQTSQRPSREEFLLSKHRRHAFITSEREREFFQGPFHSAKCFHMSTLATRGNVFINWGENIVSIRRTNTNYHKIVTNATCKKKTRFICRGFIFDILDG